MGSLGCLHVKACQNMMSDRLYALVGKPVQAVIKLCCAYLYFTPERSGFSFDIIDVFVKRENQKKNGLLNPNQQR